MLWHIKLIRLLHGMLIWWTILDTIFWAFAEVIKAQQFLEILGVETWLITVFPFGRVFIYGFNISHQGRQVTYFLLSVLKERILLCQQRTAVNIFNCDLFRKSLFLIWFKQLYFVGALLFFFLLLSLIYFYLILYVINHFMIL